MTYSLVYSKAWVNATRQLQGVSTKWEFLEHRHTALTVHAERRDRIATESIFCQDHRVRSVPGRLVSKSGTFSAKRWKNRWGIYKYRLSSSRSRGGGSVHIDSGPIAACAPWAWHHIVWRNLISKTLSPLVKKLIAYWATRWVKNAGKIDGKNTLFAVGKLVGSQTSLEHLVKHQTFRSAVMWHYQLKYRASRTFPLLQVYSPTISCTANREFFQ